MTQDRRRLALLVRQLLTVLGLASSLWACTTADTPPSGDAASMPVLSLADFSDGNWLMRVDRVLRSGGGAVTFPSDALTEQDYMPATTKVEHSVTLSMQGKSVSIAPQPWLGQRSAANAQQLSFELGTGTFAGGRFLVWQASQGLQAELTLYGSGVPIVMSERGPLVHTAK